MSQNHDSGNILAFLLGGAIGAAIALLYAPASGEETRRRIREEAAKAKGRIKEGYDTSIEELEAHIEDLKKIVRDKKDEVKAAYEAGKEAYQKEKMKHAA